MSPYFTPSIRDAIRGNAAIETVVAIGTLCSPACLLCAGVAAGRIRAHWIMR